MTRSKRSHLLLKSRFLINTKPARKAMVNRGSVSGIPVKKKLVPDKKDIEITKTVDPDDPDITIFKIVKDNETYTIRLDHRAMNNIFVEALESSDLKNEKLKKSILEKIAEKHGKKQKSRRYIHLASRR